MPDILEVHERINEILPGTLVTFNIDAHLDCPLVRWSARYETRETVYQATELCSSQVWPYVTVENIESWFFRHFKDLL